MLDFIPIIGAYLVGAIPFGVIITRLAGIDDIRQLGSGNIGATNVWRAAGFKIAVWVFIGDIGKGALAVLGAKYYAENFTLTVLSPDLFFVICAALAVLGHIFPVYLGFKGGKGVNTALGAMLVLLPIEILISFGIFIIVVLIFRYISLGSILGAIGMLAVILLEKYYYHKDIADVYLYLGIVLTLTIIITHHQNISRLISGTENRFSFSSKTGKGGDVV